MTTNADDTGLPVLRVKDSDRTFLSRNLSGSFPGAIAGLRASSRDAQARETLGHVRGKTIAQVSAHPSSVFFSFTEGPGLRIREDHGVVCWELASGPDPDSTPSLPPQLCLDFGEGYRRRWNRHSLLQDWVGARFFFLAPERFALSLEVHGDPRALRFSTLFDTESQRELLYYCPEAT